MRAPTSATPIQTVKGLSRHKCATRFLFHVPLDPAHRKRADPRYGGEKSGIDCLKHCRCAPAAFLYEQKVTACHSVNIKDVVRRMDFQTRKDNKKAPA